MREMKYKITMDNDIQNILKTAEENVIKTCAFYSAGQQSYQMDKAFASSVIRWTEIQTQLIYNTEHSGQENWTTINTSYVVRVTDVMNFSLESVTWPYEKW